MLEPIADLQMELDEPAMNSTWRVGQPIKLMGGFHNSGGKVAWLDGRIAYTVHLIVKVIDQRGRSVAFPGSSTKIKLAPPVRSDFVKLVRGASLLLTDVTAGDLMFKKPGTYTISLRGSHGSSESYAESFGIRLGSIGESKSVTIKVVP